MHKTNEIDIKLVFTAKDLSGLVDTWSRNFPLVVDVETFGHNPSDGKLLGLSLCSVQSPLKPVYVVLQLHDHITSQWIAQGSRQDGLQTFLKEFIMEFKLIGHGYAYDKLWLDWFVGGNTDWTACTRIMWHLAAAPSGPRPYGLKDAQVELLGWEKRGDEELAEQVKFRGGDIKRGDHYLAEVDILGKYACYDAASTAMLFNYLSPFYDKHDYWWMLQRMVDYSWLLQECTSAGVQVDSSRLEKCIEMLSDTKGAYSAKFLEQAETYISRLERFWREDRAAKYISKPARDRFLSSWALQKKFNLSSDKDKQELFYDCIQLPKSPQRETEGGKPSTSLDSLKAAVNEMNNPNLSDLLEGYAEAESAETLLNSFAKPWLKEVRYGRLHPRFNPCGTVSYRLSGFKPYLLNAPFDEKELMACLTCDKGWVGIHADFTSIEPAVTAHYSQDPHLLKVFRDGQGDVYLDLATTLFPSDHELAEGYLSGRISVGEAKKLFKKQRSIAKIIQLAVQYTGTKYTVSKNLTIAGFPTTLEQADVLVKAYWQHFRKVAIMNEALFLRYAKQGYLRNVVGRIIRVPNPRYKDLPNRFIQSSAHDLLSFWVLRIFQLAKKRGLTVKPVLIDCHDSTSNQCPESQAERLEGVYRDALIELNAEVKMTVPVKVEMKRFITLAGLKGEEV